MLNFFSLCQIDHRKVTLDHLLMSMMLLTGMLERYVAMVAPLWMECKLMSSRLNPRLFLPMTETVARSLSSSGCPEIIDRFS